jgi:hypothetical protein
MSNWDGNRGHHDRRDKTQPNPNDRPEQAKLGESGQEAQQRQESTAAGLASACRRDTGHSSTAKGAARMPDPKWQRLASLRSSSGANLENSAPKEDQMETANTVIAIFADHQAAETAVKKLNTAGFEIKDLSVVGKGYHTDEKVVGFYNVGDRVKFWGRRGAFWGGLWGLFFGGLFMAVPVVGHVIVLGYLAVIAISAIETAVMVGGLSALGAALYSICIPRDSVIEYETALQADSFLVMAHGTAEEMARARAILGTVNPSRLDVHAGVKAALFPEPLLAQLG